MNTAEPGTYLLPGSPRRQGRRHGHRLARDGRGTYRTSPIRVGVVGAVTVHRLGLVALIDELDVASAHDAAGAKNPEADVLVLADPTDDAPTARDVTGHDPRGRRGGHSIPVIVATSKALNGREVLRWLTGPVRGVVALNAPPTTWACAIAGVAAGGYAVDPVLTRGLVLLAAVGTRYGPRPLGLTAQQQRILGLVATGLSNRAIASELGISPETVKTHLTAAMHLLGAGDRIEAAQKLAAARGQEG